MKGKLEGAGCVVEMLVINGLLMGLAALSFTQGPYSSREQELWYRYGSMALLFAGAVLPAVALLLGANRWPWAIISLRAWMVAMLVAFIVYAFLSGGGV